MVLETYIPSVNHKKLKGWVVGEDESLAWGRCSHNYTHTSQRYLQTAYDLHRCSWCCDQILEDRECFFLQMKCMLSASVEIISYWAWLVILVWKNKPKLKETTVNHFALRHYRWIEVYTCSEHGKSVKTICQNRMSFSYIFSWSCQVWLLTPPFFPNVSTSV